MSNYVGRKGCNHDCDLFDAMSVLKDEDLRLLCQLGLDPISKDAIVGSFPLLMRAL